MGGTCNCVTDSCNKDTFLFNNDVTSISNRLEDKENGKLKNYNKNIMGDPKYQKMSKEFFDLLNDIRTNPEKYIRDSREHSLLEIFFKLKTSSQLNYSEKNIDNIRMYLINAHFTGKSCLEQENEIKALINDGNVKNLCLFQTICTSNDLNENLWTFLQENEDDLGKIFSDEYNHLTIVCFPIEKNKINLINLIFYKE